MTFKVGNQYIQTFGVAIKHWTVIHRRNNHIWIKGEQWCGELLRLQVYTDAAGVEYITLTNHYAGTLSAGGAQ